MGSLFRGLRVQRMGVFLLASVGFFHQICVTPVLPECSKIGDPKMGEDFRLFGSYPWVVYSLEPKILGIFFKYSINGPTSNPSFSAHGKKYFS